ncbi:N-acetylmuramic acid 6-phosphate etherase [Georgenia thermotolerans]|uniref:N-acetylmuramic acid 6-phosphate etherase n=1 Tax=Georgenia thermotolerans TaxID=527326 RepID=A0A7J5US40_9MICO|nr:N-acetylmuramic acid 6-phosphate etherase [Georgenia thermotolerans]KAE8765080.1 N-acetylmuramic acid 6-phosphate etherase [Georgenia thermotolerans]
MLSDDPARLDELLDELSTLTTEAAGVRRGDLDTLSTLELVREMNVEDAKVPAAVGAQAPAIAAAVDGIVGRMRRGGRLIYLGAGTAGRIGILDASECPPTFGTDPGLVVGLIAGGPTAIQRAVENSEDDREAAAAELVALGLTERDAVVGISASGRTPYVVGGLKVARSVGAFTVAIAQNAGSAIGTLADVSIEVVVGPEIVAGSTRLKSGTAQKLVVNMLSTLAMVRLGKTYNGVMVDLQATNDKLKARSVRTVMRAAGVEVDEAARALAAVDGSVKKAILVLLTDVAASDAQAAIDRAGGLLRVAIEQNGGTVHR